ncbi:10209_t:CDS:2 [Acaulospora colombiana]|uniref:10209_t:CDS:1 n=1 Tax=Acaulospora colombiana TaxID=27376 RepID=A0ACA9KN24_9GLOM|nr:10209_t:CDS:2 [Acaulospora colombiana]
MPYSKGKNTKRYDVEDIEEISRIRNLVVSNTRENKEVEDAMIVDVDVESPKSIAHIYPYEFWKLDPISQANVKLFNKDYNNLKVFHSGDLVSKHQALSLAPQLTSQPSTLLNEGLSKSYSSSNQTESNPTSVVPNTRSPSVVIKSDGSSSSTGIIEDDLSYSLISVNSLSAYGDFSFLPNVFHRLTENQNIDFSLLNSSQITEDVFINVIVRYIYEKKLFHFEFSSIRQSLVLTEYAVLVLRNQHNCKESTPEQLTSLFMRSLMTLVNEEFLTLLDEERYEWIKKLLRAKHISDIC